MASAVLALSSLLPSVSASLSADAGAQDRIDRPGAATDAGGAGEPRGVFGGPRGQS